MEESYQEHFQLVIKCNHVVTAAYFIRKTGLATIKKNLRLSNSKYNRLETKLCRISYRKLMVKYDRTYVSVLIFYAVPYDSDI